MMSAVKSVLIAALLASVAPPALAQTVPPPTALWARDGVAVRMRPLSGDGTVAAIEITTADRVLYGSRNGYAPRSIVTLWQPNRPGPGPDLVLAGQSGDAHCCLELTVVTLAANPPVQIIRLAAARPPAIADRNGVVGMTVPFTLAAESAPVDLPVAWDGARFAADLDRLGKLPPQAELRRKRDVMRAELAAWTIPAYTGGSDQTAAPKTATLLLALILNGQAHAAKTLLYQAWPVKLPGRELYWRELSHRIKSNPLWSDLGLARLPNTGALDGP